MAWRWNRSHVIAKIRRMPYAFPMILSALVLMSGCSSGGMHRSLDEDFARLSEDERARMCTSYYHDAKVSCREGMQDATASHSFECLSARMKIERSCLSPR